MKKYIFYSFCVIATTVWAQKSFLPPPINSILYNETNPVLGGMGKSLLFLSESSQEPVPSWSISYGHDNSWSSPQSVDALNYSNKTLKNISPSINFDENKIYFSSNRYGGIGSGDIWFVNKNGKYWDAKATNIGMPINSKEYETDPFLAPDDKTLFFVRYNTNKTADGKSCGDIYTSTFSGNKWSIPVKLPAPINTGFEANPVLLNDNRTLLFASQRKGGLGSFDVYMSRLSDANVWSDPVPYIFFNTKGDDRGFSVPGQGNLIYSFFKNKEAQDIVRYAVPENFQPLKTHILSTKAIDKSANKGMNGKLHVTNLTTNSSKDYLILSDKTSRLFLYKGNTYELVYTSLGGSYIHHTQFKDLTNMTHFENSTYVGELNYSLPDITIKLPHFSDSIGYNYMYINELKRISVDCKSNKATAKITIFNTYISNDSIAQLYKTKLDSLLDCTKVIEFNPPTLEIDLTEAIKNENYAVIRFDKE